jgi:hypothetical protein
MVCDGGHVPLRAAGGDHHIVGDRALAAEIDDHRVLGLVVVQLALDQGEQGFGIAAEGRELLEVAGRLRPADATGGSVRSIGVEGGQLGVIGVQGRDKGVLAGQFRLGIRRQWMCSIGRGLSGLTGSLAHRAANSQFSGNDPFAGVADPS